MGQNYHDLYVFMQVVQEGGFSRAAARLQMTQPAVSRLIARLEARLGVALINRTTRKLSPTQAGEMLYRSACEGFSILNGALERLAHLRDTPSGTVRITASQYAIDHILLPKLSAIRDTHPDIRVELIGEQRFVDIIAEHYDAGVRMGGDVAEGMVAVRIALPSEMAVVGAPAHFAQYGIPQTVSDLPSHPCIAYQFADGGLYAWELYEQGKKLTHTPQGQWVFADNYPGVQAARAGLGLAYVPLTLVQDDIKKGSLIRVLQAQSDTLPAFYLYYPQRNIPPALRVIADILKE